MWAFELGGYKERKTSSESVLNWFCYKYNKLWVFNSLQKKEEVISNVKLVRFKAESSWKTKEDRTCQYEEKRGIKTSDNDDISIRLEIWELQGGEFIIHKLNFSKYNLEDTGLFYYINKTPAS